ncbi:DUF636 domain protein [Glonium stellatum]|uniref:DUF636 domain protein n=1 Tax=Glonium stellatum TaxID=574774 RepID=A0A8E2FBK5_9PEZI|nr:DUF636 domain protein [Glonium stellatum]
MPTGSCMYGEIQYEYIGEPALTALCHCRDYQKWSGSGETSNVVVPRSAFKITKGNPKVFVRMGGSGQEHLHFFCGNCGSSLYSQPVSMPDVTIIKTGGLNGGAADIPIAVEFYTKDRQSFCIPIEGAQQAQTMS